MARQRQIIIYGPMKNIEIKVRVSDRAKMLQYITQLGAESKGVLRQTDTYFNVPSGRLKMREERSRDFADIIFYNRPNKKTSRLSEYDIIEIQKSGIKGIKKLLSNALSSSVIVKKVRRLYMYQHTRVHLDHVNGLGDFLELETVVKGGQKMIDALKEHRRVVRALGLESCEKIPFSYSDLLLRKHKVTKG